MLNSQNSVPKLWNCQQIVYCFAPFCRDVIQHHGANAVHKFKSTEAVQIYDCLAEIKVFCEIQDLPSLQCNYQPVLLATFKMLLTDLLWFIITFKLTWTIVSSPQGLNRLIKMAAMHVNIGCTYIYSEYVWNYWHSNLMFPWATERFHKVVPWTTY